MWSSIIAVLGTLAGSITAYALQQRASRAERAEQRAAEKATAQLTAVTALVAALADHRLAMWLREELRLAGTTGDAYKDARAHSHTTRSAITAPLTTVTVLAPALAAAANEAANATYALRGAPRITELEALRDAATAASDRLLAAATAHFSN
ncbi:protein kilB [Streptomyces sp. NPDC048644]|uniref:protein kilB n=1 Tax=Streptomyces sp. NPDC048644 TaxID=3365582 RepID=UPI003722D426